MRPIRGTGRKGVGALATVVVTLALFGAALALAEGVELPASSDLDGDGQAEKAMALELCESSSGRTREADPPCRKRELVRQRVAIEDVCHGEMVRYLVSQTHDYVKKFELVEVDGDATRPEVFFEMRSGAAARGGEIRIVSYEAVGNPPPVPQARPCNATRNLFRYPSVRTVGRIPAGERFRVGFYASLRDYSPESAGEEVRLTETYVDRAGSFCCPSARRITHFRYEPQRDRYVRYRTRVTRA